MQDLYLIHHGVQGQQWGKKNGSPYPLDAEGKAELRAQKKAERAQRRAEKEERKIDKVSRKFEDKMMRDIRGYSGEAKNIARKRSLEAIDKSISSSQKKSKIYDVTLPLGLGLTTAGVAIGGAIPLAIATASFIPISVAANRAANKQLERERKALDKVSKMKI